MSSQTTTTVVPKTDGSVQFVTTLQNPAAPTEYTYELDLPDGARIVLDQGDTAPLILDADGKFIAGIAPAWAKDANRVDVPTRYAVDGHTITQIVEHVGNTTAYPVVADPWLGLYLIQNWYWTTDNGGWRMNSTPTTWSRSLNAATQGAWEVIGFAGWRMNSTPTTWSRSLNAATQGAWEVIGFAGWDELANAQTGNNRARMNVSMQQQHVCHQGFASHDAEWNVEGWKSSKWGPSAWIASRCN